jgi:pimeloyl-ACP methyl ester carboxylesterase
MHVKRVVKWIMIALVVLVAGGLVIGYTPDTDPAAMKVKYAGGASRFLDLGNGLNVHYRDEGKRDGRVLVLIHGSNASLHTWEPWVKRLGPDYRIISLDLPGHGLTGPNPSGRYDTASFVEVVDRVMAKLAVEKAVIGGNSMGGGVSWNFALAHPNKTAGLILLDAGGAPRLETKGMPIGFRIARTPGLNQIMKIVSPRSLFAKSLRSSVSVQSIVNEPMIDRYWELNRYPGNRAATLWRFQDFDKQPAPDAAKLSSIGVPTLILWGADDQVIPVQSADWFARGIKGSQRIIYPKVGHLPMEETADQSATDVRNWLMWTAAPNVITGQIK